VIEIKHLAGVLHYRQRARRISHARASCVQRSKESDMTETQLLTYKAVPGAQPKAAQGEAAKTIELPRPDLRSGMPLMTALTFRASSREFAAPLCR
jgi:hypothetical protein